MLIDESSQALRQCSGLRRRPLSSLGTPGLEPLLGLGYFEILFASYSELNIQPVLGTPREILTLVAAHRKVVSSQQKPTSWMDGGKMLWGLRLTEVAVELGGWEGQLWYLSPSAARSGCWRSDNTRASL